ncbi:Structural component of the gap junctions protein, partial [Tyrophagus putrescentiae]
MIIGPNGRKMPETEPQVRIFCKNTFQMLRQVENFWKNCFKSPVKEYASVAIYTVRIQIKKYCTSKKSKVVKELLKLAPCANKYIIHNNSCLVKMENKINRNLIIFAVYCSESAISDVACLRPHLASVMDFYRGIAQSQVDMICGEYNGQNDVCQKLTPPKTSKINRNKYYNIITKDILYWLHKPISCMQVQEMPIQLLDTICWTHSTYTTTTVIPNVVLGAQTPNVVPEERVYQWYYKWMCWALLVQTVFFYGPHFVWKRFENGLTEKLSEGLTDPFVEASKKRQKMNQLSEFLHQCRLRPAVIGVMPLIYVGCQQANLQKNDHQKIAHLKQ